MIPADGATAVGAAEVDLTPRLGTELAGLFDDRIATAVESPLLAKAIAISSGGETVILIVCDLIYLPSTLVDQATATDHRADRHRRRSGGDRLHAHPHRAGDDRDPGRRAGRSALS